MAARRRAHPSRKAVVAWAALVKIGWWVRYGEVQPLAMARVPPRKSMSDAR